MNWLVLSLSFICPSKIIALGFIPIPVASLPVEARPQLAKLGLCKTQPEMDRFVAREDAEARVRELGPDAAPRLRYCDDGGCKDVETVWHSLVEFKEKK